MCEQEISDGIKTERGGRAGIRGKKISHKGRGNSAWRSIQPKSTVKRLSETRHSHRREIEKSQDQPTGYARSWTAHHLHVEKMTLEKRTISKKTFTEKNKLGDYFQKAKQKGAKTLQE